MFIDFLLKIHSVSCGLNAQNHYKGNNFMMWIVTNVTTRIITWILNGWISLKHKMGLYSKKCGEKCEELVVSITTYPARMPYVWKTIESLMRQQLQPEHIVMYLSREDFPRGDEDVSPTLLPYIQDGLEIKWVDENLKPHKKYIYAFRDFPCKCIITVDDDIYYRRNMTKRLWQMHLKHPDCICANRVKAIPDSLVMMERQKYKEWKNLPIKFNSPSHYLLAIGVGGILYPVSLFVDNRLFDVETICHRALSTDDLWLKVHELINNIKIFCDKYEGNAPSISCSQNTSLSSINWAQGDINDINWKLLREKYPEIDDILFPQK